MPGQQEAEALQTQGKLVCLIVVALSIAVWTGCAVLGFQHGGWWGLAGGLFGGFVLAAAGFLFASLLWTMSHDSRHVG